jgi:hypothetical protein
MLLSPITGHNSLTLQKRRMQKLFFLWEKPMSGNLFLVSSMKKGILIVVGYGTKSGHI